LDYRKTCQFYNLHTCLYHRWNVGEDWFSSCWDIRWDRPIFAVTTLAVQILSPKTLGSLIQISPIFHKMYGNDCWLNCWNQNCDIPIPFRTPVCQMNENREISAKSQHHFHFLPHFNSKTTRPTTTRPIFTIFSHDVEQRNGAFLFRTREQRVKTVNFDVSKNRPKLIGYHSNDPWTSVILMSVFQFYNPHTYLYQSWNVGEDRFSSCWDIQWHRPIFAVSFQKYKFLPHQSMALLTKVHHICTRCRGIIGAIKLFIHIAIFQSALKCQGAEWRSFCHKIGCHGNVPWKTGPDRKNSRKYLPFGEKIVKIGPVDTDIALLIIKIINK